MTPEDVLAHKPVVLSQEQRQLYFDQGFLKIDGLMDDDWLNRLRSLSDDFIEASRAETESYSSFLPLSTPLGTVELRTRNSVLASLESGSDARFLGPAGHPYLIRSPLVVALPILLFNLGRQSSAASITRTING